MGVDKTDLAKRMKLYESAESDRRLMPLLPVMVRLDGRCFSKFTSSLKRPYDERLSELMIDTTEYLCRQTQACMGYTQSDEISLTYLQEDWSEELLFGGRISKLTSVLAALCTGYFIFKLQKYLPEKWGKTVPVFDCRVWNVPDVHEGANVFLWREKDATKNSISMAAGDYYSHNELMNKTGSQKQDMLFAKGINWDQYPSFFKRGTFVQRRTRTKQLSIDDAKAMSLPEKHHYWTNPDIVQEVTEYVRMEMPPFTKITNRPEVIYYGDEPLVLAKTDVVPDEKPE